MELGHIDGIDPQARASWKALFRETAQAMQDHCGNFITPISRVADDDWGELEGTGGYVEVAGKRLLITNEHVIRDFRTHQFTHQFFECEDIFKLTAPLAIEAHPVDAAICAIGDAVWGYRPHTANVVPFKRFANRHQPVPGELFFFAGYTKSRSKPLYKYLESRATPLLTQELRAPYPADLHANHFMLSYPPARAESVDPRITPNLPNADGLSGSLVWNSRRIESLMQGKQWSPEMAQVTGLLCRVDTPTLSVLAIRIEIVLDFLKRHCGD